MAFAVATAATGCGSESGVPLQLVITRADALMFPPETVEVLVYGSRAACSSLAARAETATDDRCAPGADEESGTCYLNTPLNLAYADGATTERIVLSVGQRNVLVRGKDSFNDVTVVGCSSVTINEGEVAAVTVVLDDI